MRTWEEKNSWWRWISGWVWGRRRWSWFGGWVIIFRFQVGALSLAHQASTGSPTWWTRNFQAKRLRIGGVWFGQSVNTVCQETNSWLWVSTCWWFQVTWQRKLWSWKSSRGLQNRIEESWEWRPEWVHCWGRSVTKLRFSGTGCPKTGWPCFRWAVSRSRQHSEWLSCWSSIRTWRSQAFLKRCCCKQNHFLKFCSLKNNHQNLSCFHHRRSQCRRLFRLHKLPHIDHFRADTARKNTTSNEKDCRLYKRDSSGLCKNKTDHWELVRPGEPSDLSIKWNWWVFLAGYNPCSEWSCIWSNQKWL